MLEHDVATIINEEFNLFLVEVKDEVVKITTNDGASEVSRLALICKLVPIMEKLGIMVATRRAIEGVIVFKEQSKVSSFLKCKSIAKYLTTEVFINDLLVVFGLVDDLACTVVKILKEVLTGSLCLGQSHRDVLNLCWVPLLKELYQGEIELVFHDDDIQHMWFVGEYLDIQMHVSSL